MIEVRVPGTVFGFGFQMSWPIVGLTHDVLIIQVVSMYGAPPGNSPTRWSRQPLVLPGSFYDRSSKTSDKTCYLELYSIN